MVTTVFTHVNAVQSHTEYRIKVTIVEIYLEKIKDLLTPSKLNLSIREDRTHGVYIQDATEKYVTSEQEVFSIINSGNSNRSTAVTNMNEGSSRYKNTRYISTQLNSFYPLLLDLTCFSS